VKICLLSFWFAEYVIQLANALSKKEQVTLILPDKLVGQYTGMIDKNVELDSFHCPRLRYPTNLLMIYKILRQISKVKPDIIHLQERHIWFNLVLPFIKKKYPIVTTIHDVTPHYGDKESRGEFFADMPIKYSSGIIVHGNKLVKELVEKYNVSNDRIYSIHHGVLSLYKEFINKKVTEDKYSVLFFGRIWEYKGLRYLIEAEPYISRRIPNLRIIIAGQGEDFSKYEKMMVHKERFIVYNNYISNKMLAELFQKASIVVLPYVDGSQSGVVPMAYAFKKPVVATNVGSIPEVVNDGRTGYIVPPRDSVRLADAIIKLLENENLRKRFGENAYQMTKNELSWDNIAVKTIKVYKECIYH
jgi:glycosyltransferase involved in cell wall biosynthesis